MLAWVHISGCTFQTEACKCQPKHANATKLRKGSHSQANRFRFASMWFTFQLLYGCVCTVLCIAMVNHGRGGLNAQCELDFTTTAVVYCMPNNFSIMGPYSCTHFDFANRRFVVGTVVEQRCQMPWPRTRVFSEKSCHYANRLRTSHHSRFYPCW